MTISNYQIYQKPTEHLKTEAEKGWYWAKPVLLWGVLPTITVFSIIFLALPSDWHTWTAAIVVGLISVGFSLYHDPSIFNDSVFAFVYAINSLLKCEKKFGLALLCLLTSSLMLTLPALILYWLVMSSFNWCGGL